MLCVFKELLTLSCRRLPEASLSLTASGRQPGSQWEEEWRVGLQERPCPGYLTCQKELMGANFWGPLTPSVKVLGGTSHRHSKHKRQSQVGNGYKNTEENHVIGGLNEITREALGAVTGTDRMFSGYWLLL